MLCCTDLLVRKVVTPAQLSGAADDSKDGAACGEVHMSCAAALTCAWKEANDTGRGRGKEGFVCTTGGRSTVCMYTFCVPFVAAPAPFDRDHRHGRTTMHAHVLT
eukprot:355986-Chlamydomonas_euryale.AAC.13